MFIVHCEDFLKKCLRWLINAGLLFLVKERNNNQDDMKHQLANRFCRILAETIGPDGIAYCQERNKSYGNVCPSHDFCDANEVMGEAFIDVVGSEMGYESDSDIALWNSAWTIARANNYIPVK